MFLSNNLDILLIHEPWTYRGEVRGVHTRTNAVIWNLSSERPRSCTVVRYDIVFFFFLHFRVPNAMQMKDKESSDFALAEAYFREETATAPHIAIHKLMDTCRRNKGPIQRAL